VEKPNRDVAIKVLPPALAEDTARVARFEREAQLLAALNHPNMAAIYGIKQGATATSWEIRRFEAWAAQACPATNSYILEALGAAVTTRDGHLRAAQSGGAKTRELTMDEPGR